MSFRVKTMIMSVDDLIMQIMAMNEALNNGECAICRRQWDDHRPPEWPTAKALLHLHGMIDSRESWIKLITAYVGKAKFRPKRGKMPRNKGQWCRNCGKLEMAARGRCKACYDYRHKNGHDRPEHLWNPEARCKTCGIPLSSLTYGNTTQRQQRGGYCITCYSYKQRFGIERPQRLWGDGPHGWCMCGYPAVALVAGDIPVCSRHQE